MPNEIINNMSKYLRLGIEKPTVIAKKRKSKVLNDLARHKESNIWVGWIKINFLKIGPDKKNNVGHFVNEEIIDINS